MSNQPIGGQVEPPSGSQSAPSPSSIPPSAERGLSSAEHRVMERQRKVDTLGIYGGLFALAFGFWLLNPWLDAIGDIPFFRYIRLVPEWILGGVSMLAGIASIASIRFEFPHWLRILMRSVIFFLWVFCAAAFWLARPASLLVPLFGGLAAMEFHSLLRAWGVKWPTRR